MRGLEYALEVLRAFYHHPGKHDSKNIHELVQSGGKVIPSLTYVQKILPRMTKIGLLTSSESGYSISKSIDAVTVANILDMCDMPDEKSPLYKLCSELKKAVSLTSIEDFYEFGKT